MMAVKLKIRATESLKLVATKSDFNACYMQWKRLPVYIRLTFIEIRFFCDRVAAILLLVCWFN